MHKNMEISLENIIAVEKQRGRSSNTLKVTRDDGQLLFVPESGGNRHYQIIKEWIEHGNKISPPPPKTKPENRPETAFIQHPTLETPNDNQVVWRYMSFEQFVSLLLNKSLWFSRGDILKNMDPYEGQLPEPNLKASPNELFSKIFPNTPYQEDDIRRFFESHRANQDVFRANTLINCWNMFDHESYSMWKVYGKGNNCVAIKTNIGALKNSFGKYTDYDVYLGKINYIDYVSEPIDESNYLNIFMHKTPFYSTENELRCIILDDGDISIFPDNEPYYWGGEEVSGLSPGANVPCDINVLLRDVIIGPDSDSWFESVVKGALLQFGYSAVNVIKSAIR